jgi:eukaryotic-like serine/threonine-protein kinase
LVAGMEHLGEREDRLGEALAECLRAREKGEPPPIEDLLRRHPDLSEELRELLSGADLLEGFRERLFRDAASLVGMPAPGEVFAGFAIVREIARGGMGIVFEARQPRLERSVALKVVLAGRLCRLEERERFIQEALAASRLEHPGIVPIHDVGEAEGLPYYTMMLIGGGSLADRAKDFRGQWTSIARTMALVAHAIHHAHSKDIIHRDLKPANILLGHDDLPFVADFGLAKVLSGSPSLTRTGALVGSPSYMAPEQIKDPEARPGPGIDVYGIGAILYELLTGRPPFAGGSSVEILRRVCEDLPEPPRRSVPGVPRDLETICLKALEKEPSRRYASARELAVDLESFAEGKSIVARPTTRLERAHRWISRHPALAIATAACALALISLGVAGVLYLREQDAALVRKAESAERTVLERRKQFATRMQRAAAAMAATGDELMSALAAMVPAGGEEDLRSFDWHHLWRQAHGGIVRMNALGVPFQNVGVSPDGATVVCTAGEMVAFVEAATGRRIVKDEPGQNSFMSFSPDGSLVTFSFSIASVNVWDARTGTIHHILRGHSSEVHTARFSHDGKLIVTTSNDGTAIIWGISKAEPLWVLRGHKAAVIQGVFSLHDELVATSSEDGTVRLWDAASGTEKLVLGENTPYADSLAFSGDGGLLAMAGRFHGIRIWEVATGAVRLVEDDGVAFGKHGTTFSRRGVWAAERGDLNTVRLWEVSSGKKRLLEGHEDSVTHIEFSDDENRIASVSNDGTLILWDPSSAKLLARTEKHPWPLHCCAFPPDGSRVYAGDTQGELLSWRIDRLLRPSVPPGFDSPEATLECGPEPPRQLAFHGGSRRLIAGTKAHEYLAWSLEEWFEGNGIIELGSIGFDGSSCALSALSPDGSYLLAFYRDGSARIFRIDFEEGSPRVREERIQGMPWPRAGESGAFLPGPPRFLACADGKLTVWRREDDGKGSAWIEERRFDTGFGPVSDMAGSPDSRYAALAKLREPPVLVFDLERGAPLQVLEGHARWVVALAFSADSRRLATGSLDETARLWELEEGGSPRYRQSRTLEGHTRCVSSVAFSPDGKVLATGGDDGHCKLWDARSGDDRMTFQTRRAENFSIAFSGDGLVLAWGGKDSSGGVIHLWHAARSPYESSGRTWNFGVKPQ